MFSLFETGDVICHWVDKTDKWKFYTYRNVGLDKHRHPGSNTTGTIVFSLRETENKDEPFEVIIKAEDGRYWFKGDFIDPRVQEFVELRLFVSSDNEAILFGQDASKIVYFQLRDTA